MPTDELYSKLEISQDRRLLKRLTNESISTLELARAKLPGQARIDLNDPKLGSYIYHELCTEELDKFQPYLWLVSTQDSSHISSITHQRVKGREILVSEKMRLHLVWTSDRVFIKPIPKYLLSYSFWEILLDHSNHQFTEDMRKAARQSALGFIRSYVHLIRHKTDFILARDTYGLLPKNVTYAQFAQFIEKFSHIDDDLVTPRYHFGELRLGRLNFWVKILCRKFVYEKIHHSYGSYFARFYGPILFTFGAISIVLSAMQVALQSQPPKSSAPSASWDSFVDASKGFSLLSIILTTIVAATLLLTFLCLVLREFIFATRDLYRKSRVQRDATTTV
jgi:hypothetical protein